MVSYNFDWLHRNRGGRIMNDQLLAILAQARIDAMLREAESYRLLIENRPVPAPNAWPFAPLRRAVASVLYRAAEVIAAEA
jgi:hypothetical protein